MTRSYLRDKEFVRYLKSTKQDRKVLTQYRFLLDQLEGADRAAAWLQSHRFKRYVGTYLETEIKLCLKERLSGLVEEEKEILDNALRELDGAWLGPRWEAFVAGKRSRGLQCLHPVESSSTDLAPNSHNPPHCRNWWRRFHASVASLIRRDPRRRKGISARNITESEQYDSSSFYASTVTSVTPSANDPTLFSKLLKEKLELVQQLRQSVQDSEVQV